jgi:hypothetical protein
MAECVSDLSEHRWDHWIPFEDREAAGAVGFMEALERYDLRRTKTRFTTHAYNWMQKRILELADKHRRAGDTDDSREAREERREERARKSGYDWQKGTAVCNHEKMEAACYPSFNQKSDDGLRRRYNRTAPSMGNSQRRTYFDWRGVQAALERAKMAPLERPRSHRSAAVSTHSRIDRHAERRIKQIGRQGYHDERIAARNAAQTGDVECSKALNAYQRYRSSTSNTSTTTSSAGSPPNIETTETKPRTGKIWHPPWPEKGSGTIW